MLCRNSCFAFAPSLAIRLDFFSSERRFFTALVLRDRFFADFFRESREARYWLRRSSCSSSSVCSRSVVLHRSTYANSCFSASGDLSFMGSLPPGECKVSTFPMISCLQTPASFRMSMSRADSSVPVICLFFSVCPQQVAPISVLR